MGDSTRGHATNLQRSGGGAKGFTLTELLVVIAIIALLMAILMPSLNLARKQARSAGCKMNMHSWGLIWDIYCEDNNGLFPDSLSAQYSWPRGTWIVALRDKWDTRSDILRCPSAVKRPPNTPEWGSSKYSYIMGQTSDGAEPEECSYGANCWIYNFRAGVTTIQWRPTAYNWRSKSIRQAYRIPIFGDALWRGGGPAEAGMHGDPAAYKDEWNGYDYEMQHFCIDRHNGFVNQLFMDWSARTVGLKELWTLKWHRQFNTRGYYTKGGGIEPSQWPQWMRRFKDY
ncbi:MAG: type II secretion system protein [Sedimentisphaerales bacterium]|nr:type II secretion system protein [Sedimentisphaerales bacterium]